MFGRLLGRTQPTSCDAASIRTMNLQQVIDTTALLANKLKELATTHGTMPPAGAGGAGTGPLVVVAVAPAAELTAAQAVYDAARTYIGTIPVRIMANRDVGARQGELVDAMMRLNSILARARGGAAAGAGTPPPTSENVRIASDAVTTARTALETAVAAVPTRGGENVDAHTAATALIAEAQTDITNIPEAFRADPAVVAARDALEAAIASLQRVLAGPAPAANASASAATPATIETESARVTEARYTLSRAILARMVIPEENIEESSAILEKSTALSVDRIVTSAAADTPIGRSRNRLILLTAELDSQLRNLPGTNAAVRGTTTIESLRAATTAVTDEMKVLVVAIANNLIETTVARAGPANMNAAAVAALPEEQRTLRTARDELIAIKDNPDSTASQIETAINALKAVISPPAANGMAGGARRRRNRTAKKHKHAANRRKTQTVSPK